MEDFLEAAERILEDLPRLCNEEDFSSGLLQAEVLFRDIATLMYDDEFVEVSVLEEVFVEIRSMVTTLLELVEEEIYLLMINAV